MYETKTAKETCGILKSDTVRGLSGAEAQKRYREQGPNVLRETGKKSRIASFVEQLNDPLIYVLLASAAISLFLHETGDAVIILAVVGLNAFVGVAQEGKAQKALDSLKRLTQPKAFVIRDGRKTEILAQELVCGDLVCLEAGMQVPADLRLVSAAGLQAEESALTGEAVPVWKDAGWLAADHAHTALGDRCNMVFMSTVVTGGRGQGIVTATGMDTEIGKIAEMMGESREEPTPLQRRLGELGKMLSLLSLGICVALFFIAVIQKRDVFEMLLTAISLAVAAVPEGLPAVVTLCLALSVTRMVKVHAIIRRLPSVETLGAVNVVCSDKTGTLTQNRMTVTAYFTEQKYYDAETGSAADNREFVRAMLLCNDACAAKERIGDPTELALLDFGKKCGWEKEALERDMPRVAELSFDSDRKMMSTSHRRKDGFVMYAKGAPDRILQRCRNVWIGGKTLALTGAYRQQIEKAAGRMASQALRVLAVACRTGEGIREQELTFLGLVGMKDPIRPEAAEAVQTFRQAGVSTVMITGDHVETAYAIAKQLGIVERMEQCMRGEQLSGMPEEQLQEKLKSVRVFARVSPANKVQIVKGFQKSGKIVAMTGDGVNDAPSLKAANVGIAMGKNGTDVARQASDMVLADDNFATIEKAIEEGRGVYENIKKSVIFLLSSNLGEILTMFTAVLLGLSSPLKSVHILWINLITDSLPALALGVDKNDTKSLMCRPPREAKESLFADGGLSKTVFYGILIAGISLTAFFTVPFGILKAQGLPFSLETAAALLGREEVLLRAQTYAFTVLGMSQLFHAVGMRDVRKSVFSMNHLENRVMIFACLAGFALQFSVTEFPFFVRAFGTARLARWEWLYLSGLAAFPMIAHELLALFSGREERVGIAVPREGYRCCQEKR